MLGGCPGWGPLRTTLLWPWESLRQKQEEKQLEGGVWFGAIPPPPPQWRKFKRNPKWKGKRVAGGGAGGGGDQALLKPQTPGWWCECPSNTRLCYILKRLCYILKHAAPLSRSLSLGLVLPGLCKMRRETSGGGGGSAPERGWSWGLPRWQPPLSPPPGMAIPGWVPETLQNSEEKPRREALCLLGPRPRALGGRKTEPGAWGRGRWQEMGHKG